MESCRSLWLCLSVIWICCPGRLLSQPLDRISADPDNHWFRDEAGRVRLFHGVNCVEKGFPWYRADYMLNDTRLDQLRDWGLNVVRLGTMWTGAEPTEGNFNATYIDILQDIVARLSSRGIYTLMDMHQDVMSSRYGSYDGVPTWVVDSFPAPTNPYPWPLEEVTAWAEGYLTQACSEGFQHLYDNTNDMADQWGRFWQVMANTFKGNTGVLGYELMNEPWCGDYFQNESLLLPGVAGQVNLQPVYNSLNDEIRKVDSETMIFYEPVSYGMVGETELLSSGFDQVPGGEDFQSVSTYSYHAYCWPLELAGPNDTDQDLQDKADFCDQEFIPKIFRTTYHDINITGGAAMLTEFGLCKTYEDQINVECDSYMRSADEFLQSWIDWDYSDYKWYDNTGNYIPGKVRFYARAYARAVAGIPLQMSFDMNDLHFRLEYIMDMDISAPTEVVIPPLNYDTCADVIVTSSANVDVTWDTINNLVLAYGTSQRPEELAFVDIACLK